jgi:DNA invertase Pin-like site-specific DNA recombinase
MFIRAYLRASTKEQDANRARQQLEAFAADRGWKIAATYTENVSGSSLQRPELFRLLADCQTGDVLLVEQVDRLSRLTSGDWDKLKEEIRKRHVRVVALDLPTSWSLVSENRDDIQSRILDAVNAMMLDMLAAIARKDYEDRRRRQAEGVKAAKARGRYRGRPENTKRNDAIARMLRSGATWDSIIEATGCSRTTLARLRKRLATEAGS